MRKQLITAVATGAAVLALSSPAGAGPWTHPKVHRWFYNEGGQQSIKAISRDATNVGQDASNDDITAIGNDCQSLLNDTQIAQSLPPFPIRGPQRLWSRALSDIVQGAQDCVNAANNDDVGEMNQAASYLSAGNALIVRMTHSL